MDDAEKQSDADYNQAIDDGDMERARALRSDPYDEAIGSLLFLRDVITSLSGQPFSDHDSWLRAYHSIESYIRTHDETPVRGGVTTQQARKNGSPF